MILPLLRKYGSQEVSHCLVNVALADLLTLLLWLPLSLPRRRLALTAGADGLGEARTATSS
jgi:hypothetical protein